MPTVPTELPEQARRGLANLHLDDAALAIIGAGDTFVESEKAFRQRGRLEAVRADDARANAARERENRFNAAGVRQMERAMAEFEKGKDLDEDTRRQIDESIGTQDFRDRLTDAREVFRDNIVRSDISGGEAEEILEMWDDAQTALEQEGFEGLLNRGRDRAREVREARERPNRGREPHSPLAVWKYAIIAGALVVGVASVIACFIWGGCSWVVYLLTFYGGAATSWIVAMIQNGCAPIPLPQGV